MEGYFFSIDKNSAIINLINDTGEKHDWQDRNKWSDYPILHRLLNFMSTRGFQIGRDPEYQRRYKSLNKDHWYGRKGTLEFKAERYPRGFRLEFFQNINYENKYGGYYDFDKFEKMPYMIKLMFINEANKIAEFLKALGITENTRIEYKLSKDKIKQHYVESCHYPQKNMDFNLSDLDGTTCEYSYNNTDRDGKTIYNGQIKYFRNWKGRLMRGRVYRNLNNMWWVILNDTEYTNIADFQLFDANEEDFKVRRLVKDRKPKEYIDRIEKINQTSTKELINELKRRGIKVAV
ncbi:hypothetical protein RBU61_08405 [Tissierella sp. MB52-C2]|uniref:hypothetical protein n=1 Tax=Tissierella sp. MB52-C2 TaxID=3070999 RepID=UPI00280A9FCC|nr:hypothetical protein [Tissierella sp. MB52-C2]WMM26686.1 hypothetical protein RBU61_08405 [Tissierella sp. MB52-C2]